MLEYDWDLDKHLVEITQENGKSVILAFIEVERLYLELKACKNQLNKIGGEK